MQTVLEQMLSKYSVESLEEKKNAFTKKMDKVGELTDRKRVMVFADDDNAIDTKTHFEYITHKIDLSAEGLIKAVEEAIAVKLGATDEKTEKKTTKKKTTKKAEPIEESKDEVEEVVYDPEHPWDDGTGMELIMEDFVDDDELITLDNVRLTAIRQAHKSANADTKATVKAHLVEYGGKLSATMKSGDVRAIEKALGLLEEDEDEV